MRAAVDVFLRYDYAAVAAMLREMYGRFCAFVAELIAPVVAASGLTTSAAELARSLVFAMRGLEQTAINGADMRRLIDLQVSALLALLAGEVTSQGVPEDPRAVG